MLFILVILMSEEKTYTRDEIREIGKKITKITKFCDAHSVYDFYADKKITKVTAQKILDVRNESFYNEYLSVATEVINEVHNIPKDEGREDIWLKLQTLVGEAFKEKHLKHIYDEKFRRERWDLEKTELEIPYLINYKVDLTKISEKDYETKKEMFDEKMNQKSNNFYKEKLGLDYLPSQRLIEKIKALKIEGDNFDPTDDDEGIKKKLFEYYHNSFDAVITPDLTIEKIRENNYNFSYGLRQFFEWVKEHQYQAPKPIKLTHEQKKELEWVRKYLTTEIKKNYYDLLYKLVSTNEIREDMTTRFITSIQHNTTHALDDYENMTNKVKESKEKYTTLDQERVLLHNDRVNYMKTNNLTEITIIERKKTLDKELNNEYELLDMLREILNNYDSLITRYWDKTTNTFTPNVEIHAKEQTEYAIKDFVHKNVEKMAFILDQRTDWIKFEPQLHYDHIKIEGNIYIECANGDNFRVNNQLVFVDEGYRKAHYRFPTTFHDITFNKVFNKMLSENEIDHLFKKQQ